MFKKIALLLVFSFILAGCTTSKVAPAPKVKQLINELPVNQRPFVGIFPHSSGRLLTLYIDKLEKDFKSVNIDLEYLSGNSLKGGRTAVNLPVSLPYTQGFLLGSCSTGGKCSFDTDLINGTLKTKLGLTETTMHVLKSDFLFVNKEVTSADGKISWKPAKSKNINQILADTQGLPKAYTGELSFSPIMISATTSDKVIGTLSLKTSATSAKIYDGIDYKDISFKKVGDSVVFEINQAPWSKSVEIVRDDQKGAKESLSIYALGPILLIK